MYGSGGWGGTIGDLAIWLQAHLKPASTPLADAINCALTVHSTEGEPAAGLGWLRNVEVWWHDGGTGGFRSFAAFDPTTEDGVGLAANSSNVDNLATVALLTLRDVAQS